MDKTFLDIYNVIGRTWQLYNVCSFNWFIKEGIYSVTVVTICRLRVPWPEQYDCTVESLTPAANEIIWINVRAHRVIYVSYKFIITTNNIRRREETNVFKSWLSCCCLEDEEDLPRPGLSYQSPTYRPARFVVATTSENPRATKPWENIIAE